MSRADQIDPIDLLLKLFRTFVANGAADRCLPQHLANITAENIHVVGAGKAAAAMARATEKHFARPISGIVVTRYGHAVDCSYVDVIEAAHPVPDEAGAAAAKQIVESLVNLDQTALVVCVISGGASALLALPDHPLTLEQKRSITRQLLKAGANIEEINCVRKHLSAVKGGKLMQKISPASALTLCISDVVGDDPSVIGSGPTVADPSTCQDALAILDKHQVTVPKTVRSRLLSGELETPKPHDPVFEKSSVIVAAKPSACLKESAALARKLGLRAINLGAAIKGSANEAAKEHADLIRMMLSQSPNQEPFVVLSGGETTVKVTGNGKGGPNTQFILALSLELQQTAQAYAIACDSDGIDGTENNAGALLRPDALQRAKELGLDPQEHLDNNDSYQFFKELEDLIITGPTLTNINDFRAVYVVPNQA